MAAVSQAVNPPIPQRRNGARRVFCDQEDIAWEGEGGEGGGREREREKEKRGVGRGRLATRGGGGGRVAAV